MVATTIPTTSKSKRCAVHAAEALSTLRSHRVQTLQAVQKTNGMKIAEIMSLMSNGAGTIHSGLNVETIMTSNPAKCAALAEAVTESAQIQSFLIIGLCPISITS